MNTGDVMLELVPTGEALIIEAKMCRRYLENKR